jgi:hypothetical protein
VHDRKPSNENGEAKWLQDLEQILLARQQKEQVNSETHHEHNQPDHPLEKPDCFDLRRESVPVGWLEKNAVVHGLFGFIMNLIFGCWSEVWGLANKNDRNPMSLILLPKNSADSCRKLEERC